MAAILEPSGSGTSGVQTQGVVKQYQLSATGSSASTLETITPYDSGTILGTTPPGKAGLKLVSGVVQRASQILADGTAGVVGNSLVPSYSEVGAATTDHDGVPVPPTGSLASDGLSQAPQHE
jgi:hypothetical protein